MSTLYYVGNPDGQMRRLPGVPPHDLETERVRALADAAGVSTTEMRRTLLASGVYSAKDPAEDAKAPAQETPAQAEGTKVNTTTGPMAEPPEATSAPASTPPEPPSSESHTPRPRVR